MEYNFNQIDEISLLVFVFKGKDLIKTLCKYTGCEPKVYTKGELIKLYQKAIIDITRHYHIPGAFYYYFDAKSTYDTYAFFHKEMTEKDIELEALQSALFNIKLSYFSEEDLNRMKELRKEYSDVEESKVEELI